MRPLHEQFLAAITDERSARSSRRAFFGTGARIGGAAAGLALAGVALNRNTRAVGAAFNDVDVLNYALTLEHIEHALYRDGLALFGDVAFRSARYPITLRPFLETIRDHEAGHVAAISQVIADLGGEPVAEASYDFGYANVAGFMAVAVALEDTGVAAYAGAAPFIRDEAILAAALGIHSVEARHAAMLRFYDELNPFPNAVDASATVEEVLAAAGGFFV